MVRIKTTEHMYVQEVITTDSQTSHHAPSAFVRSVWKIHQWNMYGIIK